MHAHCTSLKTVNSNLGVEIARDTIAKFVNCPTLFSACIYSGRGELDEGGGGVGGRWGGGWGEGLCIHSTHRKLPHPPFPGIVC
jgi:hypothetical protein